MTTTVAPRPSSLVTISACTPAVARTRSGLAAAMASRLGLAKSPTLAMLVDLGRVVVVRGDADDLVAQAQGEGDLGVGRRERDDALGLGLHGDRAAGVVGDGDRERVGRAVLGLEQASRRWSPRNRRASERAAPRCTGAAQRLPCVGPVEPVERVSVVRVMRPPSGSVDAFRTQQSPLPRTRIR